MRRQKMILRIAVVSGLLAGMITLAGCGDGGGGRVQLLLQLIPQSLPRTGGPVQMILSLGDPLLRVVSAEARVTGPGGFDQVVGLASQRQPQWVGEVILPPNTTGQNQVYTVIATARLETRNLATQPQTITVTTTTSPPQIQASLNPSRIGFRGGQVNLNVTVESPIGAGIRTVTAALTGPGLSAPQVVTLTGEGGTRTGNMTLPLNRSAVEAVYTVHIEAEDALGQTAQGQTTATVETADLPPDPPA